MSIGYCFVKGLFYCISVAIFSATPALADVFTVTQNQGDREGSLPWSVEQANEAPGPHRIVFAEMTNGNPVKLEQPLVINGSIEVSGNGQDKTLISGQEMTRLFIIDAPEAKVKLTRMTLQDGFGEGEKGRGGALLMKDGQLELDAIQFSHNQSDFGGALTVEQGEVSLTDTEWTDNQRWALTILGGDVRLTRNRLTDNPAGAIAVLGGTLDLTDSSMSGNTADSGGALYIRNAKATLYQVTIEKNRAREGDSMSRRGGPDNSGMGGAMIVFSGAEVVLDRVTLADNKADRRGGAIYINGGKVVLNNSTLSGNQSLQAGAVAVYLGYLEMKDSTIAFNRVEPGLRAAIWVKGGAQSKVDIQKSIVARTEGLDGQPAWDLGSESANSFTIHNALIEYPGQSAPEASDERRQIQADPRLGPLADHGGSTKTHALEKDSPAIDAVVAETLRVDRRARYDQRGQMRISGKAQDMGAYERQAEASE